VLQFVSAREWHCSSFDFANGRLVCREKPNVPNVRLGKIELKKMCGGENKKY
jgi:hypothetical protein